MTLKREDARLLIDGHTVDVRLAFKNGHEHGAVYENFADRDSHTVCGTLNGRSGSIDYHIVDTWAAYSDGVAFSRTIRTGGSGTEGLSAGIVLNLRPARWRFFVPGASYDYSPLEGWLDGAVISEERAAYPLVGAYDGQRREGFVVARTVLPSQSGAPSSRGGEHSFLQATDIGSVGYRRPTSAAPAALELWMPRREQQLSRMLDLSLSPFRAYLPPDVELRFDYEFFALEAENYETFCVAAFERGAAYRPIEKIAAVRAAEQSASERTTRLTESLRTWRGHTGFDLNFDPRGGPDAAPATPTVRSIRGQSALYRNLLDYGHNGRTVNMATTLLGLGRVQKNAHWVMDATRVVDSFLRTCIEPGGFIHTLFDLNEGRPVDPFGDPVGARLSHGHADARTGNYLRPMAEAARDLCLFHRESPTSRALRAAIDFAGFLARTQNRDGSWNRAFSEDGQPILAPEEWFGGSDRANKSSTSSAIPFLLELHDLTKSESYLRSAIKAGEWILDESVDRMDYRGGALDAPNVVDKESMALTTTSLLGLYDRTGGIEFLDGAIKSGGLALTWNLLWDVPFEQGTRLNDLDFRTTGWGGINILWGAGVLDASSLWYLRDWLRLADITGRPAFRDVSFDILAGTSLRVSRAGETFGLALPGLQEQTFVCSDQAADDGTIAKGSSWGSLGWIYAAGTYGVHKALAAVEASELALAVQP